MIILSANKTFISIATFVVTVVCFGAAWPQTPFKSGYREHKSDFPPFILTGKIIDVNKTNLSVLTHEGERAELSISHQTTLVTEIDTNQSQIKKDDMLLVAGPSIDNPFEVRILAAKKDRIEENPMHDNQPDNRNAPDMLTPFIGKVTVLSPLIIKLNTGEMREIVITERTRLVREIAIAFSEIKKGVSVLVIAPPIPGKESRIAEKIVVISKNNPSFQDKTDLPFFVPHEKTFGADRPVNQETSFLKKELLPDLHQQPENPEFIYGLWLGRGLYSNRELERAFKTAKNLGIKYFKVEFKWSYIEPENNKWNWNDEDMLDVEKIIALANEYNMSIIPYFDTFMPWGEKKFPDPLRGECIGATNRWGQSQSPDPREYAEYVFTVLDKLIRGGVVVRYIELDNEISNLNDGYKSWNCFINITAKQLKEIENAAYDRVKHEYPHIMISSTTFSFPGIGSGPFEQMKKEIEKDKKTRNSFVKAYFEDAPKPKFDFLGLHETVSGSGNPYTMWHKSSNAAYEYNFGSYHEAYKIWRNILDRYGYIEKPILNLESPAILKGKQSAEIIQKIVFARANASNTKLMGIIISQLSGSRKFTEGRPEEAISIGLARLQDDLKLNEGYYGLYNVLNILSNYPVYEGKITGEIGAQRPWVEKFSNKSDKRLYVAFIPYHIGFIKHQTLTLRIGANKEAKLTKADTSALVMKSNSDGSIVVTVDDRPLLIEVSE